MELGEGRGIFVDMAVVIDLGSDAVVNWYPVLAKVSIWVFGLSWVSIWTDVRGYDWNTFTNVPMIAVRVKKTFDQIRSKYSPFCIKKKFLFSTV